MVDVQQIFDEVPMDLFLTHMIIKVEKGPFGSSSTLEKGGT